MAVRNVELRNTSFGKPLRQVNYAVLRHLVTCDADARLHVMSPHKTRPADCGRCLARG